jgi:hypothetical protein
VKLKTIYMAPKVCSRSLKERKLLYANFIVDQFAINYPKQDEREIKDGPATTVGLLCNTSTRKRHITACLTSMVYNSFLSSFKEKQIVCESRKKTIYL